MVGPPSRRWAYLVALLLGATSVTAFAPLGWFPVIVLTLGGLYALFGEASGRSRENRQRLLAGAWAGAAFGFGLFITGVSWVYVSLSTFGGMPAPVAALATFLFCCLLSLYPALAGALFVRYSPASGWQRALFFAASWTLGEWLRAWVFTGFPWLSIGYSQTPPSPLAGFAPIVGVFGVSLLTAFVAGLMVETINFWRRPAQRPQRAIVAPLLAVLLLISGVFLRQVHWTSPQGEPLTVALLQGNVPQDLKWRPEKLNESLRTYFRLARDNPATLTILPETALPAFLGQVPAQYLDELRNLAQHHQGDLLFGIVTGDTRQYANSAVSLGQSPEQHYEKSHLVPFGEFIPPGFAWFLGMASIPMSEFTSGARTQPPMNIAGQKVAVNICYEDAFGEELIRTLPDATLLVNISNVAWFGDSLAPAQHLQIARLRALETGRMMLRSTNTGMTAIIGVDGQILGRLPPFTQAALRGEVRAYEGITPYVRWGNVPVVVISLLLIAFTRRRNAVF